MKILLELVEKHKSTVGAETPAEDGIGRVDCTPTGMTMRADCTPTRMTMRVDCILTGMRMRAERDDQKRTPTTMISGDSGGN